MDKAALFCDETVGYRIPEEPEPGEAVTLKFRTKKDDADHVFLIVPAGEKKTELIKTVSRGVFDYYEISYQLGDAPVYFYFEIQKGTETCFYNRRGAVEQREAADGLFCITPGFHVPEWAKGALMYQIFIDRFYNGDPSNDVVSDEYIYIGFPVTKIDCWEEGLSVLDVDRFYGGDLQGILDKLDYLQSLKVEVLYLSPIFVSPSNHKYDCQDYEHVDPHYAVIVKDADGLVGAADIDNLRAEKYTVRTADRDNLEAGDRFLAMFMEEVHKRGMRVILDGVFNHCGSFNKWLDREKIYAHAGGYESGAYTDEKSPYRNFFRFANEHGWPDNDSYEGWWNHNTLPKLNYEGSKELYDYILKIAGKWLAEPYRIDGWRLDVAADLGHSPEMNHRFWQDFRKTVKKINPDAFILAEHYGDASSWLEGNEWDSVMNYDAFMEPVSWFLTGLEKHSDRFDGYLYKNGRVFMDSMLRHMSRLQTPSLMSAMNELSNHDHSRFLTRTNGKAGRLDSMGAKAASQGIDYGTFRAAVVIQMTWPGAPTIYYGDEVGVCGWTDPDSRRTFPWGKENLELAEFHRYLTGIRNRNRAFRTGSFKPLLADGGVIAYARFNDRERGIVVVNSEEKERTVRIPVWEAEILGESVTRIMETGRENYNVGQMELPVYDGTVTARLEPKSAMILENKENENFDANF